MLVLAIWRQLDHDINSDIDFVCGIGFDDFRLENALRAGDTVTADSEIVELMPSSRSRDDRGTAITQYRLAQPARRDGASLQVDQPRSSAPPSGLSASAAASARARSHRLLDRASFPNVGMTRIALYAATPK